VLLCVDGSLVAMPNATKVGMRSKQKSKSSAHQVVLFLPTGVRLTSAMSICSTTVPVKFPILPPAGSYPLIDSILTGPNSDEVMRLLETREPTHAASLACYGSALEVFIPPLECGMVATLLNFVSDWICTSMFDKTKRSLCTWVGIVRPGQHR
jgi:hypothetical protein